MVLITRPEGLSPDQITPSRRTLGLATAGGLFFTAYAPSALSQSAQPITTPAQGLEVETVTYPAPDGFDLPAFAARPTGEGPFPVVILVSEIFGVHEYIRDLCRRLATSGYVAIAPAFFVRAADPAPLNDMQQVMQIVAQAGYEQVMGDIQATLDWASDQAFADTSRLGITGFCWGGKVVWQAAARFDAIKAGVAWYGRLIPAADATPEQRANGQPWPIDLAGALKSPVLGLYGSEDGGIPNDTVRAMNQALEQAGQTNSQIILYDGAPHGFHADYRASYREADAKDGWARLLEHFHTHLRP